MARSSGRRSSYRSSRSRRSGRSYRSSTTIRRARGNLKAANQQKDSATVNINVLARSWTSQQPKWVLEGGQSGAATARYELYNGGVGFVNVFEILRRSDFFNCYAPMYDQFKIDMIRVKITPTNFPVNPNLNRYLNEAKNYTIVTAWDRTGFSQDQFRKLKANEGAAAGQNNPYHYYLLMPAEAACTTYSSAQTKNINTGSSFNIVRYLYPSSAQEKGQYLSTKLMEIGYTQTYLQTDGNNDSGFTGIQCPYYDGIEKSAETALDVALVNKDNPCNPLESSAIPFKPTLMLGILGTDGLTALDAHKVGNGNSTGNFEGAIAKLSVNLEFDISVTFRGLRKTQIV